MVSVSGGPSRQRRHDVPAFADLTMDLFEREQEAQELAAVLSDVEAGQGRVVLVGGEAGIGKTELLGPNLKDISRIYSREELLEEIRHPSRRIKPSMAPTRIVTHRGDILLGRVVSSSSRSVSLMVVGNRILEIPRGTIQAEETVMESLMWDGLLEGLDDEDVGACWTTFRAFGGRMRTGDHCSRFDAIFRGHRRLVPATFMVQGRSGRCVQVPPHSTRSSFSCRDICLISYSRCDADARSGWLSA